MQPRLYHNDETCGPPKCKRALAQGGTLMKLTYKCTDSLCREKNRKAQQVVLSDELVMDDKNIATLYCPKCKRKLKQVK